LAQGIVQLRKLFHPPSPVQEQPEPTPFDNQRNGDDTHRQQGNHDVAAPLNQFGKMLVEICHRGHDTSKICSVVIRVLRVCVESRWTQQHDIQTQDEQVAESMGEYAR